MNPEERKQICCKACEKVYDHVQIHRFAEMREGIYTIKSCNKTTYSECRPETRPF